MLRSTIYSRDPIKRYEMGWTCGTYRGLEKSMQGFGGENEGKRPLGRLRHRWEDSIKLEWQGGIKYSWLNVVRRGKETSVSTL